MPRALGAYVHSNIFMRPESKFHAHLELNSSGSERTLQVGAVMMSLELSMVESVTEWVRIESIMNC